MPRFQPPPRRPQHGFPALRAPICFTSGVIATLLDDLATLTRNTLVTAIAPEHPFTLIARPTPVQQRARDLLGLSRTQ